MRRWYRVHWKSHGLYPTHNRYLAGDAREAARRFQTHTTAFIVFVTVEASGERVDSELWR